MKRKSVRKHSHIRKIGDKKSTWKTSTWTFSIVTIGLALLILGLVVSVKQNLQVLGTSTSASSNSASR
jgi:hypothetical protein